MPDDPSGPFLVDDAMIAQIAPRTAGLVTCAVPPPLRLADRARMVCGEGERAIARHLFGPGAYALAAAQVLPAIAEVLSLPREGLAQIA